MKKVVILGSSGSIGKNSLDLIRRHRDKFEVLGVSVFKNTDSLAGQIKEFNPKYVSIFDKDKAKKFKSTNHQKLLAGEEGLLELAAKQCDILVMGISGLGALKPLLECLGKARRLLLANKEAIVSAGRLIMDKARNFSTEIFPVDSEAWAVFNLLKGVDKKDLHNLYITASGGPFLKKSFRQIRQAKIKDVLRHPIWRMGERISIDSATLMNKGFEVMEISCFFDIPAERIKVLIHPQSVIHALLEKKDRTLVASLFSSDMRIPIAGGFSFSGNPLYLKELSLFKDSRLEFLAPDYNKFPSLKLAYDVARRGKSFPAVLVSADEEAVNLCLAGKLKFYQIPNIVEKVVLSHQPQDIKDVQDVFLWHSWAKEKTRELVSKS